MEDYNYDLSIMFELYSYSARLIYMQTVCMCVVRTQTLLECSAQSNEHVFNVYSYIRHWLRAARCYCIIFVNEPRTHLARPMQMEVRLNHIRSLCSFVAAPRQSAMECNKRAITMLLEPTHMCLRFFGKWHALFRPNITIAGKWPYRSARTFICAMCT